VSVLDKATEKVCHPENAESNGQPDQASEHDYFQEMRVNTRMDKANLHIKVLKDSTSFRRLWGSNKNYLALQKVSSRGNKENEQSHLSQPSEVQRPKPELSDIGKENDGLPSEEKKGRKGGKTGADQGLGRGAVRRLAGRQTGTCKWFNTIKGYGFILPEEGTDDIFVHQTAIKAHGFRSLAENERVEFDVEVDADGRKKARNVTSVGGGYVQGAPFVYPYMMRPRPQYVPRGYGRGGAWQGGGNAEDMGYAMPPQEMKGGFNKTMGYRYHGGRGRGGGSAVDYGGSGNGQVENFAQPNRYVYQQYGGQFGYESAGYQPMYNYGGGQQYMVPSPLQQPQRNSGMIAQQMQNLSLQQMSMGVGRSGISQMQGSPQQPPMYGYAPTMPPLDSGRGTGRRSRGGANVGKGSGNKEQS